MIGHTCDILCKFLEMNYSKKCPSLIPCVIKSFTD